MKSFDYILWEYFNNRLTWNELYVLTRSDRNLIAERVFSEKEHSNIDNALGYYEIFDIKEKI